MGAFVSYNIYVALYLAVMYLVFRLLLSDEKQAVFNRVLIGCIVLTAFAAPGIRDALQAMGHGQAASGEVSVQVDTLVGYDQEVSVPLWTVVLVWMYLTGALVAIVLTAVQYVRMLALFRGGEIVERDHYRLVLVDNCSVAPFSWFRYVVMNKTDYNEGAKHILTHEEAHIRAGHSVDMILMQLVCIVQWFNPAAWLLCAELKTVHEFQADASVIRSGANIKEYQMLLIKKAVGSRFPALANSLNHSNLKKRITMMYKSKTEGARRLRALAIAPALALGLGISGLPAVTAVASNIATASFQPESAVIAVAPVKVDKASKNTQGKGAVGHVTKVSDDKVTKNLSNEADAKAITTPLFPGGDKALAVYIAENLKYPAAAKAEGREGKTAVQFTVGEDGAVRDVMVLKSISDDLDAEAIRVVTGMPNWVPGTQGGKPVAARVALPINFKIHKGADATTQNKPIIMVDGKVYNGDLNSIAPSKIEAMEVVKNKAEYPNGLIVIRLKK